MALRARELVVVLVQFLARPARVRKRRRRLLSVLVVAVLAPVLLMATDAGSVGFGPGHARLHGLLRGCRSAGIVAVRAVILPVAARAAQSEGVGVLLVAEQHIAAVGRRVAHAIGVILRFRNRWMHPPQDIVPCRQAAGCRGRATGLVADDAGIVMHPFLVAVEALPVIGGFEAWHADIRVHRIDRVTRLAGRYGRRVRLHRIRRNRLRRQRGRR